MGFDISYTTTDDISPVLQREIIGECNALYESYSWVNVTGPSLEDENGRLAGSSRLSPMVDADDAEDARLGGRPDGRLRELLKSLCKLSAQFDIDWEIEHDHSDGVVGFIRGGVPDNEVQATIEGLDAMFEEMDGDFEIPGDF